MTNRPKVLISVDLEGASGIVDLATLVPGVSRVASGRTLAFSGRDMAEAYRVVQLLVQLAQIKPG